MTDPATEPVWYAITRRRSVRTYQDRPLEDAHVERILKAGRRAASSKNQQRRAFVVVRDRERLRALSKVGNWAGPLADAAMGVAYASLLGEGESFTTLELKINYLKPVRDGVLVARGRVVRAGRTIGLVECDVEDANGSLVARASSTCMTLRGEAAAGR